MATTWNNLKEALNKLSEEELKQNAVVITFNSKTKDYKVIKDFDSNLLINENTFDEELEYGTYYLEIF